MADYKEATGTAKKWTRCRGIRINNPYQQPLQQNIVFEEEEMAEFDDGSFQSLTNRFAPPSIITQFDPAKTIELHDPTTLEPTGQTMTYGEIYVILFSAYLTVAKKRDIGEQQ